MEKQTETVDNYLSKVPEERLTAFNKLRELCLTHLPGHEEKIVYNLPSYVRKGQVEVALASQKQHLTIYFLIHEVMLNNVDRLKGMNHGKGAIRYSDPNKIDFDLIRYLLVETNKSDTTIC